MSKAEFATVVRDREGRPEHAVIRWNDYMTLLRAASGSPTERAAVAAELQRVLLAAETELKGVETKFESDADAEDNLLAELGETAARYERQMVSRASDRLGVEIAFGIPHEVVRREIEGVHPVRAWREYRGLNQAQLAAFADVSRSYLSQIETNERTGTVDVMVKLARNLRCMIEDLIPDDDQAAPKD